MRRPRRLGGVVAVLTLVTVELLARAGPVAAHSDLIASDPAYGATVGQTPERVRLQFDEPLDLSVAEVTLSGPGGRPIHTGRVEFAADHREITVAVPALPAGRYTLTYWFLAAGDGHLMGGEVLFRVAGALAAPSGPQAPVPTSGTAVPPGVTTPEPAGTSSPPRSSPGSGAAAGLGSVVGLVDYAALVVLLGGIAFLVLVWPGGAGVRRTRRLLWSALGVSTAATIAAVGLKGTTLARLAPGELSLTGLLGTRYVGLPAARLAMLLLVVPLLGALHRAGEQAVRSWSWRAAMAVVALGLLTSHGLIGHSAAGGGVGLLSDVVHVGGASVWLGGLVVMVAVVIPRRRVAELADVVPRFSAVAFGTVVVMAVAGVVLLVAAVRPEWARLPVTGYGRALLAKLVLFGFLLQAAHRSRSWTRRKLATLVAARAGSAGECGATVRPFAASVAAEVVVGAGVLALAVVLANQPPPT